MPTDSSSERFLKSTARWNLQQLSSIKLPESRGDLGFYGRGDYTNPF